MSPIRYATLVEREGFPRVSGDEPPVKLDSTVENLFSPRERG